VSLRLVQAVVPVVLLLVVEVEEELLSLLQDMLAAPSQLLSRRAF